MYPRSLIEMNWNPASFTPIKSPIFTDRSLWDTYNHLQENIALLSNSYSSTDLY